MLLLWPVFLAAGREQRVPHFASPQYQPPMQDEKIVLVDSLVQQPSETFYVPPLQQVEPVRMHVDLPQKAPLNIIQAGQVSKPVVAPTPPSSPAAASPPLVVREPYTLRLDPFVDIGIESVRPRRAVPANHFAVCPSNRAYCIDYKASDNGTCMYPGPVEIKQCYDQSCINSAWGPIVHKQQGEDTYCKDFMTSQGRLCQWVDSLPCTCTSKSILYYDAEFIPDGGPVPAGFARPDLCTYPLDLIRKAADEAALKAREKRNGVTRRPRRKRNDEEDGTTKPSARMADDKSDVRSTLLVASVLLIVL